MEAAHPQVKFYYKECCHGRHLCMMKRVFGYSTHLSESNMRPIYAFQLSFHLLPFILITSGALFHLAIWNSQRPLSEQLLFLQITQTAPLFTKIAEGSLNCQFKGCCLATPLFWSYELHLYPSLVCKLSEDPTQCLVHNRNTLKNHRPQWLGPWGMVSNGLPIISLTTHLYLLFLT